MEQNQLLERLLAQASAAAVFRLQARGGAAAGTIQITYGNARFWELAGTGGQDGAERLFSGAGQAWRNASLEAAWSGRPSELRWRDPSGGRCYDATCVPLDRGVCGWLIQDRTEEARLRERLEETAVRDPLTGLGSWEALRRYCTSFAGQDVRSLGVAYLDINRLKALNEAFGYQGGNRWIADFGRMLRQRLDGCRLFRVGGGTFAAAEENVERDRFLEKMRELKRALAAGDGPRAACGYLWESAPVEAFGAFLRAETLMRADKNEDYACADMAAVRPALLRSLLSDLEDGRYQIYLQPKIRLRDGALCGAEALARRACEDGAILSPAAFIPFFEREDMISNLDFYIFAALCRQLRDWDRTYDTAGLVFSVNFSRLTLAQPGMAERLEDIRRQYGVPPQRLAVEVTETRQTLSEERMGELLQRLKDLGYYVELDDFGKAYSSVGALTYPGLDVVKLDACLVRNLCGSEKTRLLVTGICEYAARIGLECLAEGVETPEQLDAVRAVGCEMAQGFLFSEPLPAERFAARYLAVGGAERAVPDGNFKKTKRQSLKGSEEG